MKKKRLRISSLLTAKCPSCHIGRVLKNGFVIDSCCPHCGYDFYPEVGFYTGSIVIGFLLSAIAIIPPLILLKILDVKIEVLVAFPFIEFLLVGPILMIYCRIIWLHLEYQITERLLQGDK